MRLRVINLEASTSGSERQEKERINLAVTQSDGSRPGLSNHEARMRAENKANQEGRKVGI
jgi:hypothetical protein